MRPRATALGLAATCWPRSPSLCDARAAPPAAGRSAPLPSPDVVAKLGERELKRRLRRLSRAQPRRDRRRAGERGAVAPLRPVRARGDAGHAGARARAHRPDRAGRRSGRAAARGEPAPEPTRGRDRRLLRPPTPPSSPGPPRVHLRQILVEDRLVAERARRELVGGRPVRRRGREADAAGGGARRRRPGRCSPATSCRRPSPTSIFALPKAAR